MAAYTVQMKAEIVLLFGKCEESYTETKRKFQTTHNYKDFSTINSVKNWFNNFLKTGNVEKMPTKRGLRKVDEAKEEVAAVLKKELENIEKDPNYLMNLMFSDEAHFHLDGGVNRHNCRMWCNKNPNWVEEQSLHSPRVPVWGAITFDRIIGPYFFEGNVTGDSYLSLLQTQFWPEISINEISERIVFMQDGAPPHYTKKVREWLDSNLQGRWIGRGSRSLVWPPRSSHLTPMN